VIAIQKGEAPPDLVRAGGEHAEELCKAYEANPGAYTSGVQKMVFRETIYQSTIPALEACHNGKCCYCEPPLDANSEVEHWRPKSKYYWLAYTWDNLLYCCGFCNKKKLQQFPLADPDKRAMHHGMRIEDETPEILKPDGDIDPRDHIKFHGDRPEGLTPLGCKTIEVLGLDSPKRTLRARRIAKIRADHAVCVLYSNSADPEERNKAATARNFIEEALRPHMPYSAMVADFLAENPLPNLPA
jgi:uncharacterized protein (TIGR02646 family)